MTNSSNKLAPIWREVQRVGRIPTHPRSKTYSTAVRAKTAQRNSHSSPFMLAKKSSYASPEEQLGLAAALGTLDGGRAAGAALGVR